MPIAAVGADVGALVLTVGAEVGVVQEPSDVDPHPVLYVPAGQEPQAAMWTISSRRAKVAVVVVVVVIELSSK